MREGRFGAGGIDGRQEWHKMHTCSPVLTAGWPRSFLAEGFIGDDVINELLIVRFLAAGDRADGIASFSAMTTVTDSSGNTTSGICSLDPSPPTSLSFRLASCHSLSFHLASSSSSLLSQVDTSESMFEILFFLVSSCIEFASTVA
jgi:hypothetical protein